MRMRKQNQNGGLARLCNVHLPRMFINAVAGLLLVGCQPKEETFVCHRGSCDKVSQSKPFFSNWQAGTLSVNLSQGRWFYAYEIIDGREYYFYEAQFTVTLVEGSNICFYDSYLESTDQSAGTMDLSHFDPSCDFGLVKWSYITNNPYGLNGLHLSGLGVLQ